MPGPKSSYDHHPLFYNQVSNITGLRVHNEALGGIDSKYCGSRLRVWKALTGYIFLSKLLLLLDIVARIFLELTLIIRSQRDYFLRTPAYLPRNNNDVCGYVSTTSFTLEIWAAQRRAWPVTKLLIRLSSTRRLKTQIRVSFFLISGEWHLLAKWFLDNFSLWGSYGCDYNCLRYIHRERKHLLLYPLPNLGQPLTKCRQLRKTLGLSPVSMLLSLSSLYWLVPQKDRRIILQAQVADADVIIAIHSTLTYPRRALNVTLPGKINGYFSLTLKGGQGGWHMADEEDGEISKGLREVIRDDLY